AAFERGGRHYEVVVAGHFSGGFKMGPNTSVLVGSLLGVRPHGQDCQHSLQILQPSGLWGAVARSTPCHSSATVIAATSNFSSGCPASQPFRSKEPLSP